MIETFEKEQQRKQMAPFEDDDVDDNDEKTNNNVVGFWLIWFINQRALYNHALSVIVGIISVGIIGIVCAHLSLP